MTIYMENEELENEQIGDNELDGVMELNDFDFDTKTEPVSPDEIKEIIKSKKTDIYDLRDKVTDKIKEIEANKSYSDEHKADLIGELKYQLGEQINSKLADIDELTLTANESANDEDMPTAEEIQSKAALANALDKLSTEKLIQLYTVRDDRAERHIINDLVGIRLSLLPDTPVNISLKDNWIRAKNSTKDQSTIAAIQSLNEYAGAISIDVGCILRELSGEKIIKADAVSRSSAKHAINMFEQPPVVKPEPEKEKPSRNPFKNTRKARPNIEQKVNSIMDDILAGRGKPQDKASKPQLSIESLRSELEAAKRAKNLPLQISLNAKINELERGL